MKQRLQDYAVFAVEDSLLGYVALASSLEVQQERDWRKGVSDID